MPSPPIAVLPVPGSFKRWLRSDMLVMRWVLLGLYLLAVLSLSIFVMLEDFQTLLVLLAVFIFSQVFFILGGGTFQLCRPIRRRRLTLPIIAAAGMFTVLFAGFVASMFELTKLDHYFNGDGVIIAFWSTMALSWIGWGVLLFVHVREMPRFRALSRLATYLFAGSLAELLAAVPSHIIVSRRPGCLVGILTMLGIIAGLCVMMISFGPMIVLLFLRPRYRAEKNYNGPLHCQACGYDLRVQQSLSANADFTDCNRCPECGLPFASAATVAADPIG